MDGGGGGEKERAHVYKDNCKLEKYHYEILVRVYMSLNSLEYIFNEDLLDFIFLHLPLSTHV